MSDAAALRLDTDSLDPIRVALAEDDAVMRMALGALVASDPGLELLGVAEDADGLIDLAARVQPDVCVVDVGMPGGGGPRATREVMARSPWSRVVALSGHEDRETVVEMLRAGASSYIVKGCPPSELLDAIHAAAQGGRRLSQAVTDGVVSELADKLAVEDIVERARRETADRIERVLRNDLITMIFQPIVDVRDRTIVGFESLARFRHEPVRSPDAWFAEAADVGRAVELELAAAHGALEQLDRVPADAFLTINLSPLVVASPQFADILRGVDADRVVIEITEHAPVNDYAELGARLDRLRARGLRLAIDDAGAGFASLRHILRLAPDIIKLDMTLTRNLATSRAERALTSALISFATEIGAIVVAEGIENQAEIDVLRSVGVRFGQGHELGRPGPLAGAGSTGNRIWSGRRSALRRFRP